MCILYIYLYIHIYIYIYIEREKYRNIYKNIGGGGPGAAKGLGRRHWTADGLSLNPVLATNSKIHLKTMFWAKLAAVALL